ncbi:MAG: threonine synthase [Clostridiales bacterium]|nr:threonine synthase [Clostridiales bacterium]
MELFYTNTRDSSERVTASQAILNGLAGKGGLYVPTAIPHLEMPLSDLAGKTYQEIAYEVMRLFLTDFTEEELRHCIESAYDEKFDCQEIAPIREADGAYFLELYHGATAAFKDMALSILPHLLITAAKKNHITDEIVILTATSGDTGKAALAGFAGVEGTKIIVFYPKDGVSPIQERQMVTQQGDNTLVVGIHGNFDEAQTGVKQMFSDPKLNADMAKAGYRFSSANSINVGRLVPQIVYYVYACAKLTGGSGEHINVVVPTGNFGNILAAYYARCMGMPIDRLVCASNENKVLYDFFSTGVYDRNREFVLTSSPSMDILISSNLERLIYRIAGDDAAENEKLMRQLTETGVYKITQKMREQLDIFYGNFADEAETAATIHSYFKDAGYLMDTHTAVAAAVYGKYVADTGDRKKTVIASTASPFKFTRSVMKAINSDDPSADDMTLADRLAAISGVPIPKPIDSIRDAAVVHHTVCDINEMEPVVRDFLKN